MTDRTLKLLTIMTLRVELGDLKDIERGKPSLYYGGFKKQHGRPPTTKEIEQEKAILIKKIGELENDQI